MDTHARIGVLFDSLSDNIGDMAMIDAIRDGLAPHGWTSVDPVQLLSDHEQVFDAVLVGGGELIRPQGDVFYDHFRLRDGFALCGVGVWEDADDLDYLANYHLVSARSSAETEVLAQSGLEARTIACPTAIMDEDPYPLPPASTGRRVAIHLVPATLTQVPHAVEIINEIPGDHLLVPFTRYNGDRDFMQALPLRANDYRLPETITPRQMRSIIKNCDMVVASSLHMTLFAIAYGVPFVSYRQPKVLRYLQDRGLDDLTFNDDESLRRALKHAEESAERIRRIGEHDRETTRSFFAELSDQLAAYSGPKVTIPPLCDESMVHAQDLLLEQARAVRTDRDRLINALFMRNIETLGQLNTAYSERDHYQQLHSQLAQEVALLKQERETYTTTFHSWCIAHTRAVVRRIRENRRKISD